MGKELILEQVAYIREDTDLCIVSGGAILLEGLGI